MEPTTTRDMALKPTVWRMALIYCVFVGISGGIVFLLGERQLMPVFAGVGLVFVLWMRKQLGEDRRTPAVTR
jgi:hypothetical protein